MSASRFRLVSDRELRRLETRLIPALDDWGRRWLDAVEPVKLLAVSRMADWAERQDRNLWGLKVSGTQCVLRLSSGTRTKWIAMMLGAETLRSNADTPMTARLWSDSASELIHALADAVGGKAIAIEEGPEPMQMLGPEWHKPGSGSVLLQLDGAMGRIEVALPGKLLPVNAPEVKGPPVVSLRDALGGQKLFAEMMLASEELALKELLTLQVGDVIALEQRCDHPLTVRIKDTDIELKGYLGQRSGAKAFVIDNANGAHEIHQDDRSG